MRVPHKVLGVAFLCLLVSGVWFTNAIFTKKFVDYERVTLQTSRIGLQLPARADVKVRGVIVGEVLDFAPTDVGAEMTLGIFPDEVAAIPENVTGSILPKTLFGEKYVSLEIPDAPTDDHLAAGDVIKRTDVSIEVEQVLSDLYPLLTAVQPGDINMTLNAIATALEGRGDKIGEHVVVLDGYLKRINPQIPALIDDLRLTSEVSDLYADVMPQIAQVLRNTVTTGNTLKGREARLKQLFVDVAAFSDTTKEFLDDNGDNLIRLGRLSASTTAVFAKYAPEYPCLMNGILRAGKLQAEAFRNFTLHINLETLPHQPRAYTPADTPRNGDTRGPNCGALPNPSFTQANPWTAVPDIDDGVDSSTGKGTSRVAPRYGADDGAGDGAGYGAGYVGSPEESLILKGLLGPALGLPASDVADLGVLLLAPMARGAEVSLR